MICGKRCANLLVGNNREIDEKAEDSRTEEGERPILLDRSNCLAKPLR